MVFPPSALEEFRYSSYNLILFIQPLFLTHNIACIIICFLCLINHKLASIIFHMIFSYNVCFFCFWDLFYIYKVNYKMKYHF